MKVGRFGAPGQDAKLEVPLGELMGASTLIQCSI
jgi:hypothetical protein